MESRYRAADAQRYLQKYGSQVGEDLALRVYTSHLLGKDPALVLHGGGNTSVKTTVPDFFGEPVDVAYIKGSGSDLSAIEPNGFPACRLEALRRLCDRASMTDEEMVQQLRSNMLDPTSPTPSVEALLHAFLPAKFVDHTHADAVLGLIDQPDSEHRVREVFGERALFIPYVMPGFVLVRKVADIWRERTTAGPAPTVMILDKHGIFTWGDTALESYERMIANVTRAERALLENPPQTRRTIPAPNDTRLAEVALLARGALMRASGRPWVLSWRVSPQILSFCARDDFRRISQVGCATPDHVIRTKPKPLILESSERTNPALQQAIERYAADYNAYFARSSAARHTSPKQLDPWPRVLLLPGLGMVTVGATKKDADVVGDVYEHTTFVIDTASSMGGYAPVAELDLFDVEYWSLEQAKLAKGATAKGALDGRVALITGAASGIGLATACAFLEHGAHVLLLDRDEDALDKASSSLPRTHASRVKSVVADVTSEGAMQQAFLDACRTFGGIDIVVSNAGNATTGLLHTPEGDAALNASLQLNLLSHQLVAREATRAMLTQGVGGVLLFNASKSAFNQGPDFGPYAVAKAALISLMRQYAVDYGKHGIRANAINADRIRTNLFGDGVLESRAKARGLSTDEYFRTNLLTRETTATDVADAFVYLARAEATTGCVITVDGGNAAAFPR